MTTPASGREPDDLRLVAFIRDYTEMADGFGLVSSVDARAVHRVARGPGAAIAEDSGKGWVTAEYSMLPGWSVEHVDREATRGEAERARAGDPTVDRAFASTR